MKKKIIILGSTGKLGSKLLSFLNKNKIFVDAITCNTNFKKINFQKYKYKVNNSFILSNYDERNLFIKTLKSKINLIYFLDFGSSSLTYLDIFLNHNKNSTIAIANKEMIIAGGKLLFDKIKKTNNTFIPLDSEHFSLRNINLQSDNIKKLYITASGGPFFFKKISNFNNIPKKNVLSHPKWKMGLNNLIDSSNFINKILEIFELSYIYNIPLSKIDFLVSKEAFIHSLVEFDDGVLTINCFKNDMLLPLIYPLRKFYEFNYFPSSYSEIFKLEKFSINKNFDKRFVFFKYYKIFKELKHDEQIDMLLLNNFAQKLYLSDKIKYIEIIPTVMNNLIKLKRKNNFRSINDILDYIDVSKSIIQNV